MSEEEEEEEDVDIVVCRDTVVVHSYHIAFRAIPLSLHTLDALATHQKY